MRDIGSPTHPHYSLTSPSSHILSLKTREVEEVGEKEPKIEKKKGRRKRKGEPKKKKREGEEGKPKDGKKRGGAEGEVREEPKK